MQPAHAVRGGGQPDRERGHVEVAVVGPDRERLLGLAADVADPRLEVAAHELLVEGLVARRHRRVGGEDGGGLHRGERLGQAVARLHPLARALEREERDVALVHVPDGGVDAERAQRAHAAGAEHDLLAQPHLAAAHVERARDRAVGRVVERDVGVEHQHRHQAHLHLPHRGVHHAAGQVDRHGQHAARRGLHRQHRQPREVVVRGRCAAGSRRRPPSGGSSRCGRGAPRPRAGRPGRSPPCSGPRPGRRGRPSRSRATRGSRTPSRSRRPGRRAPCPAGRTSAGGSGTRRGPG